MEQEKPSLAAPAQPTARQQAILTVKILLIAVAVLAALWAVDKFGG